MIDSLRRLHPVHHNVPAVWEEFEQAFKDKFMDSTRELRARNQLEQLKFKYPDIDEYIANFDVTAEAWHQLGRLVRCNGEGDVSAQSLRQAQLRVSF
jgi:hypothetical protein